MIKLLLTIFIFFFSYSSDQHQVNLNNSIISIEETEDDIINGLKEILIEGSKYAINEGSQKNGFNNNKSIRILIPNECVEIKNKLSKLGFSDKIKLLENKMNYAAEDATSKCQKILIDCILNINIKDGLSILNGRPNEASLYLKNKYFDNLYAKIEPLIIESMNQFEVLKLWNTIIRKYNSLPFTRDVETNLIEHITKKTIDGLFILIAEQEMKIRENPVNRNNEILKKIFIHELKK